MSVTSIVGVNVKLLFLVSQVDAWQVLTLFPSRDRHRELLNRPRFIRSGQPVNSVAVSERPSSTTDTL